MFVVDSTPRPDQPAQTLRPLLQLLVEAGSEGLTSAQVNEKVQWKVYDGLTRLWIGGWIVKTSYARRVGDQRIRTIWKATEFQRDDDDVKLWKPSRAYLRVLKGIAKAENGLTDTEGSKALDVIRAYYVHKRHHLKLAGLVGKTGLKRPGDKGYKQVVWGVTKKGKQSCP